MLSEQMYAVFTAFTVKTSVDVASFIKTKPVPKCLKTCILSDDHQMAITEVASRLLVLKHPMGKWLPV